MLAEVIFSADTGECFLRINGIVAGRVDISGPVVASYSNPEDNLALAEHVVVTLAHRRGHHVHGGDCSFSTPCSAKHFTHAGWY